MSWAAPPARARMKYHWTYVKYLSRDFRHLHVHQPSRPLHSRSISTLEQHDLSPDTTVNSLSSKEQGLDRYVDPSGSSGGSSKPSVPVKEAQSTELDNPEKSQEKPHNGQNKIPKKAKRRHVNTEAKSPSLKDASQVGSRRSKATDDKSKLTKVKKAATKKSKSAPATSTKTKRLSKARSIKPKAAKVPQIRWVAERETHDTGLTAVQPVATVTDDLVQKLKAFASATGKAMVKGMLVNLYREGVLTKEGQETILRRLQQSPVRPRLPALETVISGASRSGPIFPSIQSLSASGTSIEAALKNKPAEAPAKPATKQELSEKAVVTQKPLKRGRGVKEVEIETVDSTDLRLQPIEKPHPPVPRLSYGLERILFNPGVYQLQDPRSHVFNFDPYLQSIMPVHEFDFEALKEYVTSSKDATLTGIARDEGKKYSGSTSSMTSALSHFHFLLSQWRPINPAILSRRFPSTLETFTNITRSPTAIFLRWKDGTYAIDADKEFDSANILMMLGKSMEKLLTLPTEEYEKYRKNGSERISKDEAAPDESFHYTTIGDFLLRSQLDAHNPWLPGTGMFDLKTRAVVSIRMDTKNYEKGLGYEIRNRHGEWESYEREYYDMIRAAFLKYSLQVRMGRMDGIFVAFHNIERIFGFQYVSLPEMDLALHGTEDTTIGDSEFKLSLALLNRVLDRATSKFPEQSLRIHFETRSGVQPFMYIFAEPVTEDEIQAIQESNKASVEAFERKILGLDRENADDPQQEEEKTDTASYDLEGKADWEILHAKVEESLENDERGVVNTDVLSPEIQNPEDRDTDEILSALNKMVDENTYRVPDNQAEEDEDDDGDDEEERDNEPEDEEDDINGEVDVEAGESFEREIQDEDYLESQIDATAEGREADDAEAPTLSNDLQPQASPTEGLNTTSRDISGGSNGQNFDNQRDTAQISDSDRSQDPAISSKSSTLEDLTSSSGGPFDNEDQFDPVNEIQKDLPPGEPTFPKEKELLAMTLAIRNKVNGKYVERPEDLKPNDKWSIEYALSEIPKAETAWKLYGATRKRRAKALKDEAEEEGDKMSFMKGNYLRNLVAISERGRKWRKLQDEKNQTEEIRVLK